MTVCDSCGKNPGQAVRVEIVRVDELLEARRNGTCPDHAISVVTGCDLCQRCIDRLKSAIKSNVEPLAIEAR